MFNWSEITISAPSGPKTPINVGRDADREITNPRIMAKTKNEERHQNEGQKSPKKKNSVRYPFYFVKKNSTKKSLERKFQNKMQTAVSGTESTVKTDPGKIMNLDNLWINMYCLHYRKPVDQGERDTTTGRNPKPRRLSTRRRDTTRALQTNLRFEKEKREEEMSYSVHSGLTFTEFRFIKLYVYSLPVY